MKLAADAPAVHIIYSLLQLCLAAFAPSRHVTAGAVTVLAEVWRMVVLLMLVYLSRPVCDARLLVAG